MSKIYFTSDLHFGHNYRFLYRSRGYNNIEEHDKDIVHKWNNLIKKEDIVYILGNIMLGNNEQGMKCLTSLNGNLKIIRGDHDSDVRWNLYNTLPNVELLGYAAFKKFAVTSKDNVTHNYHIYLSHYPTLVYDVKEEKLPLHKRTICLCGHSLATNKLLDIGNLCYHVELDAHNNQPIELTYIVNELKEIFF